MALKPGAVLGEQMLAQRYGVSRTPVREAIIRLSEERLVDVRPQQGTFVSRLDIALIPEAVVIRQALEAQPCSRPRGLRRARTSIALTTSLPNSASIATATRSSASC